MTDRDRAEGLNIARIPWAKLTKIQINMNTKPDHVNFKREIPSKLSGLKTAENGCKGI